MRWRSEAAKACAVPLLSMARTNRSSNGLGVQMGTIWQPALVQLRIEQFPLHGPARSEGASMYAN